MRTYFRYLTSDKLLIFLLIVMSIVIVSFITLAASRAETLSPQASYKLVWSDEFSGSSVDTSKWSVINQTKSTESHHQGRYLTRNVSAANGNLRIVTERHCLTSGQLPLDSNRSSSPCPSGTTTAYSSGQLKSGYNWKAGKVEIRAKLPKTTQSGLWSGYWLRQQGAWCTQDYGEIDILEWYSDPKSTSASTATTHVTCASDNLTSRQHVKKVSGSLADSWHTWGVEWDKTGVTYYLDGQVVPSISSHRPDDDNQAKDTYTDFDGVSKAVFESVMDRAWQLRVNTQVYSTDDQWHEAPDNSATFTPQTFLVDYVRVYAPGSTTSQPVPVPTPAPTSPTPESSTPTTEPTQEKTVEPVASDTPVSSETPTTQPTQSDDKKAAKAADDSATNEEPASAQTEPETDDTAVAPTKKTLVLPQTGPVFWSILGGVPLSLITISAYLWYRSRIK